MGDNNNKSQLLAYIQKIVQDLTSLSAFEQVSTTLSSLFKTIQDDFNEDILDTVNYQVTIDDFVSRLHRMIGYYGLKTMLGKAIKLNSKKPSTKSKGVDQNQSLVDLIKILSVCKMLVFRESQISNSVFDEKIQPTVLWVGSAFDGSSYNHITIETKDNTLDAFQYLVDLSQDFGNSISFSHFRIILDSLDFETCFNFLEWIEQKGWKFPVCINCKENNPTPFIPLFNKHDHLVITSHSSLLQFYVQSMTYKSKGNKTLIQKHNQLIQAPPPTTQQVNIMDDEDTIDDDDDGTDEDTDNNNNNNNNSIPLLDDDNDGWSGDNTKTPLKSTTTSNRTTVLKNMSTPSPNKTIIHNNNGGTQSINTSPPLSKTQLYLNTTGSNISNTSIGSNSSSNSSGQTQILSKSSNFIKPTHNNSGGDDPLLSRISAQNSFLSLLGPPLMTTGRTISIQLHLRDALDNPVQTNVTSMSSGTGPVSSHPIHIYIDGPQPIPGPHPAYIYVVGPGTLGITFLPTHNGVYYLHADIESKPIKHSPCVLTASSNNTLISSPSANAQSHTNNNNQDSSKQPGIVDPQKKRKQRFSTGSATDQTQQPEEDDLLDIFTSPGASKFSKSSDHTFIEPFNISEQIHNGTKFNNNNIQSSSSPILSILPQQQQHQQNIKPNNNEDDEEDEIEDEKDEKQSIINNNTSQQQSGTPATMQIEETQVVGSSSDRSIEPTLAVEDTPPDFEKGGDSDTVIAYNNNNPSSDDVPATLVMDDN